MQKYKRSIHLFRRDLRLSDNSALMAALNDSEQVIPLFVLDNRQLENQYFGNNAFQFMLNSLTELDAALKKLGSRLYIVNGIAEKTVQLIISNYMVNALYVNRDYTPFSQERDHAIRSACQHQGIDFYAYADALLTEPGFVLKQDGNPYTVFTPFMKRAKQISISRPVENKYSNYFQGNIVESIEILDVEKDFSKRTSKLLLKGGRKEGEFLLAKIHELNSYHHTRNIPSIKGTSLLSAHHKFGTVSIRETYYRIVEHYGEDHPLINELYWRDFFTHILFHFPHVLGKPFRKKYVTIQWKDDDELFGRWCKGCTGFPIVDAGMRELVETGFMHNRVRMIAASFLVKDLHLDWRLGERFFANHLIDYDPAVNNGNWQWASSTGCDAQPYFRIFNPWKQQQKFDPQCSYIKKWIPQLKQYDPKIIHNLWKTFPVGLNYPKPIVEHSEASAYAKKMFECLGK